MDKVLTNVIDEHTKAEFDGNMGARDAFVVTKRGIPEHLD